MFLSGNIKADVQPDTTIRLLEDVVYQEGDNMYTVPIDYVSDGATVPKCTSWLYPRMGEYLKSAVLHDYLITNGLDKKEFVIESNRVDELFRESMKTLGIPFARRWTMWLGVRLGALLNPLRRKGSLKTLPKVILVMLLAGPILLPASLVVQLTIWLLWAVTLPLPKKKRLDAQTV